jgi:peptide-methionine (S)-S-oxide reductase
VTLRDFPSDVKIDGMKVLLTCILLLATTMTHAESEPPAARADDKQKDATLATFGAGCFWCVEAVFLRADGVKSAVSGYTGGHTKNPTYDDICNKDTGHAEAIQIEFDPEKVSYDELLNLFWRSHDPTQLNRQGNDVGTQYRSAIFCHGDDQRTAALASKKKLNESGKFRKPVVTQISEASTFYKAEAYHQDYFSRNSQQPYCRFVIEPKLKKLGLDK